MSEQGDLLLVPFPFSDQSGKKVRPVIIVSNEDFNEFSEDVIVVGVTSNLSKNRYTLGLSDKDLAEGKLFGDSCIKVENILRLDKDLVVKKIGKINQNKLKQTISLLFNIINPKTI